MSSIILLAYNKNNESVYLLHRTHNAMRFLPNLGSHWSQCFLGMLKKDPDFLFLAKFDQND